MTILKEMGFGLDSKKWAVGLTILKEIGTRLDDGCTRRRVSKALDGMDDSCMAKD